jgi:hypothetical protein
MYRRRRRPPRAAVFGFDSFLDLVANVIGIIIRLILVAWVGARAYSSLKPALEESVLPSRELQVLTDPLEDQLAQTGRQLDDARNRLLMHFSKLRRTAKEKEQAEHELAAVTRERQQVDRGRGLLQEALAAADTSSAGAAASLDDLRRRSQLFADQVAALEKLPSAKKTLHFRVPVSRPVGPDEELMFECKAGRVTLLDFQALKGELERGLDGRLKQLHEQGRVEGTLGPVGAFRLRYVLWKEGALDPLFGGVRQTAASAGRIRYKLEFEPVYAQRGEPADTALAAGSDFRNLVDVSLPRQTVVTLWVYPDSFALYRRLRDYLHERDVEVAGRPLPEGVLIGASDDGTASRGQ